jgi:hypothetical protein
MTYVLAAPDFNRSAGSIGEPAGVGFSRMLGERVKFMAMNWERTDEPFRAGVVLRRTIWVRFLVFKVAVVPILRSGKWRSPCPEF